MFPNQNPPNNNLIGLGGHPIGSSMDPVQNLNYNGIQQQHQQQQSHQQQPQQPQQHQTRQPHHSSTNRNVRRKPFVRIVEQPASKALRFRYECEGRSAGSIPGINSTPETKTYPTIEIVGYKGRAVVVVSCVTKDTPHRPHPHNLVGKEGCKKGVCTLEINADTMRAVFSNLGIQCVKKKDIEAALRAREDIRVDPYKTGFSHRSQPSSIDLNAVRLCFQVFMEGEQKGKFNQPLAPVVSEPIYDKKAMSDLVICRLCSCSATVLGNTQIILLCEKVAKEDIAIRFYEEKNGQVIWEAFGEFQHTDVHKQTAITFKTPRYHTHDITEPAKVFIQLRRPSDGVTSEALPFEYVPLDSGRNRIWNLRRNLKRKPDDLDLFQQILAFDSETQQTVNKQIEVIDLNTPTNDQPENAEIITVENKQIDQYISTEIDEAAKRRTEHEIDTIIDEKVRELEQQHDEKQDSEYHSYVETVEEPRQLTANDKITEWMKSNELKQLEKTPSLEEESINYTKSISSPSTIALEDDKTLNELLEQVAELDEIYSDHILRRDTYNNTILNEINGMDTCLPEAARESVQNKPIPMETDESFDDAATYTSLQIAFKNPIAIPVDDIMPPTPPASYLAPEDTQIYDPVDVLSQSNANIFNSQLQSPPRPAPPKFKSPQLHVSAAEEDKLPPPLPKRTRKHDNNAENRSIEANIGDLNDTKPRPQATIVIMKTPDQSPPSKRLPPKPTDSLPRQKKSGFFSKLFTRRKSKSDLANGSEPSSLADYKDSSLNGSRELSIQFQTNDPHRSSVRSSKSLQPLSLPTSPAKRNLNKSIKTGKPVGRSVSSVSGKRPTHLNADVIHIPLKGESVHSLGHGNNEAYSTASTLTLSNQLDRRTVSALQLANIPINDGNMELVAIADRQSLRNLCQGEFNVLLDPDVDLTEAEHFALYTSIPPQATASEFDETSAYYAPVDGGEILTPDEVAKRLAAANGIQ